MYPPEHPLAAFRFHVEFRPRFSDLDAFGHVNNARFFTYFEEGRSGYLRRLGIFLPPASPVSLVVQKAECTYLVPVRHHHLVQVHVRAADWGKSRFSFHYALWLPEEDRLAAGGSTRMAAWHLGRRQSTEIPGDHAEKMRAFEQGA
ncbi:MAG: thioesterase family protein [Pseudomonadota bacterium]